MLALFSIGYLISRVSAHFASKQDRQDQEQNGNALDGVEKERSVIAQNGGIGRFLWKVTRLLSCAVLVGLSVRSVLVKEGPVFDPFTDESLLLSNVSFEKIGVGSC